MTERDITICGHGSGTPSLKNMADYLEQRYNNKMRNNVRKGLLRVRRLKGFTDQERQRFVESYKSILGRNRYSQDLREYVFKPYNGAYYSDCSSSGDACYARAGHDVGWLNTVGQLTSSKFIDVPVDIRDGHIRNPEILKVGDALLFAGNINRPEHDYCGHVEYVYSVPGDPAWHWLCVDGIWYYQDADGRNTYGWAEIKETAGEAWHRYYFNAKGQMQTGLVVVDGNTYYLQETGPLEGALCETDGSGALSPRYIWR